MSFENESTAQFIGDHLNIAYKHSMELTDAENDIVMKKPNGNLSLLLLQNVNKISF